MTEKEMLVKLRNRIEERLDELEISATKYTSISEISNNIEKHISNLSRQTYQADRDPMFNHYHPGAMSSNDLTEYVFAIKNRLNKFAIDYFVAANIDINSKIKVTDVDSVLRDFVNKKEV